MIKVALTISYVKISVNLALNLVKKIYIIYHIISYMNLYFVTSYIIFLTLLIFVSTFKHSKFRLILKLLTCAHYLGLALYAIHYNPINLLKYLLAMGLIFSFFGDLFLGLKDKLKVGFLIGIGAFSLTQLYYLLYLQLSYFNYWPFILSIVFILFFWQYVKYNPYINFTQKAYFLIVYIFLLSSTMFSSIFLLMDNQSYPNLLLTIGFVSFFISDIILFHVYFIEYKYKSLIIFYIIFYHFAQCLIAYSLWL